MMNAIASKFWMALAVLAVAGMAGLTNRAAAQGWPVVVGQQITCTYQPGPITVSVNGVTFGGTSSGSGTFQVTSVTAANAANPNATNSVSYIPVAINATSAIPGLGTITTSLNALAPAATSGTTSNQPGVVLYPASSSMTFNATGTVNGVSYNSVGPVTLQSPAVNSFVPFVNEPFTLQAPVVFTDGQGHVGFTLQALNVVFNN
jgi:hypothetical protein